MEEDIDAALDGIISGALREAEGRGKVIDSMTSVLGGKGDIRQQQAEGGQWERSSLSSLEDEKEGVEVPSNIDFRNPKFTLTLNPYYT